MGIVGWFAKRRKTNQLLGISSHEYFYDSFWISVWQPMIHKRGTYRLFLCNRWTQSGGGNLSQLRAYPESSLLGTMHLGKLIYWTEKCYLVSSGWSMKLEDVEPSVWFGTSRMKSMSKVAINSGDACQPKCLPAAAFYQPSDNTRLTNEWLIIQEHTMEAGD